MKTMRKGRLVPSIRASVLVMLTTFRTSILGILMSRFKGQKAYLFQHAREIWGPSIFRIARAELEIIGRDNVDFEVPHIFVMNHQSHMDIPAAFMAVPKNIGFVAKAELRKVPFMGKAMAEAGMVFVDRKNSAQAIASLEHAGELVRSGVNVFAFPEGTRSYDGVIRPFKKGIFRLALAAGVPIVPMAIHGGCEVLPRGVMDPFPGTIRVKFGEPIDVKAYTVEDRDELIGRVRAAVIELNISIGGPGGTTDE